MSTGAPHHRTLWEEGHRPGRLVALTAGAALLPVMLLDVAVFDRLTLLFDIGFVLACAGAALLVRPREFFVIGVFPPLLLAGTVAVLALVDRGAVADPRDGFLQALVSGLAHHAGALIVGYGLTLGLLALRQQALSHQGVLRNSARPHQPVR